MKDHCRCTKEVLVSTLNSAINQCGCGTYHVRIDPVTIHLTATQFEETARVFKLALGISAGHRLRSESEKSQRHFSDDGAVARIGERETVPVYRIKPFEAGVEY